MKQHIHSLAGAFAALAISLSLVSCSGGDDNNDNPNGGGGGTPVTMLRTSIATGERHSLALKTDGGLWTWGWNAYGQLGHGDTTYGRNAPTRVGSDSDWAAVASGINHSLTLKNEGSLWAWGDNGSGQLGLGDSVSGNKNVPTRVGTASDWAVIAAGFEHSLALKANGSLWAWGGNSFGQLGHGDNVYIRSVPTRVGTATDWAVVAAGGRHSLLLKADGSLWACGRNDDGQLGLGDSGSGNKNVPTRVGTDNNWVKVVAGGDYSLAVKADGSLWAWGSNFAGTLGLGDLQIDSRNVPTRVGTASDWAAVSAGGLHTLALTTDGDLWVWGRNDSGQLGNGYFGGDHSTPSDTISHYNCNK
jgi:alpha-tubulin suppressor-like RCC1 family protein